MAPDLYRGKLAKDSSEAVKMMQGLAIEDGIEIIRAAIGEAKRLYGVRRSASLVIAWAASFALRAACEIERTIAAALFGDIPEENVLKNLKLPTLFIPLARRLDQFAEG